jgi:hypothetical protein
MFHFTKKKVAAVAVTAAVAMTAGIAFAYWTTSGAGTGSASTGTNTAVTVSQRGTVTGLVPGGPAGAVDFRINNPASHDQYVTSVAVSIQSGWSAQADSGKPACTAADFTIVQPDPIAADLTPGDHDYEPSGASIALDNASTNQDNCKSVTVPLEFAAS